jgi:predicted nucleic acid-binding protein
VAGIYFVDSSALVKRYVREDGTGWVRRLTRRSSSTVIYIARITAVEVTSAVARRRRGRTLPSKEASSIRRNRMLVSPRDDGFSGSPPQHRCAG